MSVLVGKAAPLFNAKALINGEEIVDDFRILEEEFESYATFILEDLETFFNEYGEQIGNINWAQVKTVMQKDRDIDYFPIGSILYQKLVESKINSNPEIT